MSDISMAGVFWWVRMQKQGGGRGRVLGGWKRWIFLGANVLEFTDSDVSLPVF